MTPCLLIAVNLALALDDTPLSGAAAPIGQDAPLLDALLALHGDERVAAIKKLGEIGDPRAVPVLVDLLRTRPSGPVAEAAAHAMARFPEGVPVLRSWVLDAALPRATRIAAVESLGEAGSDPAGDALLSTTSSRRVSGPVRVAVLDTLRASYPDRVAAAKGVSDGGAVAWTVVGMGSGLGYGVATLGHFGRTQLEVLGGAAGAAGGATAGWFYARRRPIEVGDASFVTLSGWAGATGAVLIAKGTGLELGGDASDAVWLAGLAGGVGGAGIGLATAGAHPGTGRDAWSTALLTGAGIATVTTGYTFAKQDASSSATVAGAATLGGFGVAALAAPHMDVDGYDPGFVALGATWGALVGGFVPLPDRTARAGLPVTTAGVAGIAAWSLAPLYDRPGDELLGGFLGLGAGSTLGSGIELLVQPNRSPGLGIVAGSTLGGISGMALANADPRGVDGSDLLWGGLATGWVAWQSFGWLSYSASEQRTGIALTTIGAAGAGSALLSRWADVPYAASLTMGSTALWGTYIGLTAAELTDSNALEAALIGGDVGVAVGCVALVPAFQVAPVVIGLADGGGVLVGGTATVVAGLVSRDPKVLLGASLIGAGVGTVGGALLGIKLDNAGAGSLAIGLGLPRVDPPGSWGLTPLVASADGAPVYGASVVGVGW